MMAQTGFEYHTKPNKAKSQAAAHIWWRTFVLLFKVDKGKLKASYGLLNQ